MTNNDPRPRIVFIKRLCKDLPDEKIQEAEENFWAYLEIVSRIAVQQEHALSDTKVVPRGESTLRDFD